MLSETDADFVFISNGLCVCGPRGAFSTLSGLLEAPATDSCALAAAAGSFPASIPNPRAAASSGGGWFRVLSPADTLGWLLTGCGNLPQCLGVELGLQQGDEFQHGVTTEQRVRQSP